MSTTTPESPFTLAPPNAPSYRDFRTVADWASAIRGRCLDFTYEDDTGRMSVELVEDGLVLTPPNALRPVVAQVEFTVGANESLESLFLDGHDCSALFWSESAVEKFLFPCFASAAADDAARFLGRLSDAWYGYPGRVVQVCALAYRYGVGAELGQLSLEASVGLVCLERSSNTLTLMGLNEFEQKYPLGAARGTAGLDSPVPAELKRLSGWPPERVDSILAREAAELVSGLRGHYVWFTLEDGMLTPWICPTEEPVSRPDGVVMHGVAVTVRPDRPEPSSVTVWLEGQPVSNAVVSPDEDPGTAAPDAMFWTDCAVETLLLPYYASVKGRRAPYFTALLMGKWDGSILPHASGPTIVVTALNQVLQTTAVRAADDDPTVYAITHLPRSEYVSDGSPALENRTRLLTFGAEGPGRDSWTFGEHPLAGGA